MRILVLDVGGTNVKVLLSGATEPIKIPSGSRLTPAAMVATVRKALKGAVFDAVSIGYPGLVVHQRIVADPMNLGPGWTTFDFAKAFKRPVRIVNDAAMQALGSYSGGSMLFLGLGTGLGAAMIVDGELTPMELAHLNYRKGRSFEDYLGLRGMDRLGRRKWERHAIQVIQNLQVALQPDYIVLGGGNAKKMKTLPPGVRLGHNSNAFLGGFRLWEPETTPDALPPSLSSVSADVKESGRKKNAPELKAAKVARKRGHA